MSSSFARSHQCKACPWKKSTRPGEDIPGGYSAERHKKLIACQSKGLHDGGHMMACHESPPGGEYACVGWVVNQLGPGNNSGLRMRVIMERPAEFATEGEQHESVAKMCAAAMPRRKRARPAAPKEEL